MQHSCNITCNTLYSATYLQHMLAQQNPPGLQQVAGMLQLIRRALSATRRYYLQHTAGNLLQLICNKIHVHCNIPATQQKCCRYCNCVADNPSATCLQHSCNKLTFHLQLVADSSQIIRNQCLQHLLQQACNIKHTIHTMHTKHDSK